VGSAESTGDREQRVGNEVSTGSGSGSGWETFFKNASWAHRTVYSACLVHTGQRTAERGSARAQPVHQTVHSAMSGAHRTVR
jgi:hypothetical protein